MAIKEKLQNPNFWIPDALNDLYFLCRCILCTIENPTPGFKDLHEPLHRRLCNFIEKYAKPDQELLILMPRGWLKSYIITCGWLIQRFLRNFVKNHREFWIINNATAPNAEELLARVTYNFKFNELLRGFFKQYIPEDFENQAEKCTKTEIMVRGNRIEIGSVEKALESRHYSGGMINDDLVNWDNSRTRDQLEKTVEWWKISRSLKNPGSIVINIGTRWDEDDLYGHIIQQFLKITRKQFEELIKQPVWEYHKGKYHLFQACCWENPEEETGSTFPNRFPEEKIKEIIEEQGELSGGQYLNDPIAMSKSKFKRPWFRTWKPEDIPRQLNSLMTIDPTGTEKSESDYTGMTHVDIGSDHKAYIKFAQRKLVTDKSLAEWIVEVAPMFQPGMIGIEENKYRVIQELLELLVPQWLRIGDKVAKQDVEYVKTIPYICVPLTHRGRPKGTRIGNLTSWFEFGRMLMAPTGMEDLIDELLRFPKAKKDDIADALAYILDLIGLTGYPRITDPEKYLILPEDMKMTPQQREEKHWDEYKQQAEEQSRESICLGDEDELF